MIAVRWALPAKLGRLLLSEPSSQLLGLVVKLEFDVFGRLTGQVTID